LETLFFRKSPMITASTKSTPTEMTIPMTFLVLSSIALSGASPQSIGSAEKELRIL
jgi:hypothetical protein